MAVLFHAGSIQNVDNSLPTTVLLNHTHYMVDVWNMSLEAKPGTTSYRFVRIIIEL